MDFLFFTYFIHFLKHKKRETYNHSVKYLNIIPFSTYANIYMIKQIKLKIKNINQTNTVQHKNTLRFQLFNYIIDNKPFILNKGIAFEKLLKHNLKYLYYNHNLINLTYHHKLLFGTELEQLTQI